MSRLGSYAHAENTDFSHFPRKGALALVKRVRNDRLHSKTNFPETIHAAHDERLWLLAAAYVGKRVEKDDCLRKCEQETGCLVYLRALASTMEEDPMHRGETRMDFLEGANTASFSKRPLRKASPPVKNHTTPFFYSVIDGQRRMHVIVNCLSPLPKYLRRGAAPTTPYHNTPHHTIPHHTTSLEKERHAIQHVNHTHPMWKFNRYIQTFYPFPIPKPVVSPYRKSPEPVICYPLILPSPPIHHVSQPVTLY